MKNNKTFLKKNRFFVFLFTIMLFIIVVLGIYIYINSKGTQPTPPKQQDVDIVEPKAKKKSAEITRLEGEYNQNTRDIKVSWAWSANDDKVNKASLYLNNNYIDNVTFFSYYDLLKDTYGYPTGNNEVKLVLSLDNGKKIEKMIKIFVNYLISATQSVKQQGNATLVTLTYAYEKEHPVKVPSITTDGHVDQPAQYIDTKVKENNSIMTAETTYEFVWSDPTTYQAFGLRWYFGDIKESRDFPVEKGIPPKAE